MVAIGPKDDVERLVLSAIERRARPKKQAASTNVGAYILASGLAAALSAALVLMMVMVHDWRSSQRFDEMMRFHEAISASR